MDKLKINTTILLKHPLLTIIILAIIIRVIVSILYNNFVIMPDSADYLYLSELLSSGNINGYEGSRSPGYPLLLSLLGRNLYLIIGLQLVISILSLIFTYKTILLILNKKASLIITTVIAIYIPWLFYDFSILTESLTLFFISSIFFIFFRMFFSDKATIKYFLVLSLLCGYLVLIKPFYIFLPILLCMFFIIRKVTIQRCLILLIAPFLCFLGWSYINKMNTGQFVSTTFYGYNIAQNCVNFAENTTDEYSGIASIYTKHRDKIIEEDGNIAMAIWSAYPELKAETKLSFPDLSKELYEYSIVTIKLNPIDYLKQVFISWNDFWRSSIYLQSDSFSIKEKNIYLYYFSLGEQKILRGIKLLFLLFIPINIILAFKKKEISVPLIISIVILAVSLAQALVTFGSNSRFSYPFEILIVISFVLNLISIINIISDTKINIQSTYKIKK